LALAVIGISLYSAEPTNAQNPVTTLIDRISEKFNLKKEDVQKVADDFRSEKQKTWEEQRKKNLDEKLSEAVKSGKITEAQKQAILKKMEELRNKKETNRVEMQNWLKQNGLEGKFGFGLGKFGKGRGMHYWK